MHKIKQTFLHILRNRIVYDNKIIPVIIKDRWADMTPCITIWGHTRDTGEHRRQRIRVWCPLPKHHPLYDENHPNKKYPHSAQFTKKKYTIQINVWCNNEKERELIVNQVNDALFYSMHNHYDYCVNYDEKTKKCKTIDSTCLARLDKGYHGLRGQCPAPHRTKYEDVWMNNRIIKNSILIDPDFEQDENDKEPPLKRSIINVSLKYKDIKVLRSNPTLSIYADFKTGKRKYYGKEKN